MTNTNAIHSLGNGSFLIYEQGPDIISMHAGDYSSPSVAGIVLNQCIRYETPTRQYGTWTCRAYTAEGEVCFEDTLDPAYNTFLRRFQTTAPADLTLNLHPQCQVIRNGREYTAVLPKGVMYFTNVTTGREYRLYISCEGNASFRGNTIHLESGSGSILIRALRLDADTAFNPAVGGEAEGIVSRSDRYWETFFGRIRRYPGIEAVEESVAYTVKSQQSRDGGVAAGHFYPMAYVRDQAGTAKGLLKLGLIAEAKKIVSFWFEKFKKYGDIHNAETMGNDDGRLIFSNDDVEVPAYVMLTGFLCAEADGDFDWLEPFRPMFAYAAYVQCRQSVMGMTGFSGDETYIAGGMFPRCFLYHGSAESTMLFIQCLQKYMQYFGYDDGLRATLDEAKRNYRKNFVLNGKLYANQPERAKHAVLPRFHFGYCDSCILLTRPAPLTWLERRADGLYVCPRCMSETEMPVIPKSEPLMLGSVSLSVFWHDFNILSDEEKTETVKPFLARLEQRGNVYSTPDGDTATGYDYAYLLEALVKTKSPAADSLLQKTLDLLDESGSWSEYYRNGIPYNCRNRPWESAINIAAVIDAVAAREAR